MATIGANNRPRKVRWLLGFGILLLVAGVALLWLRDTAPAARPFAVPGSQDSSPFAAYLDDKGAQTLSDRLNTQLMTSSGLVSWYQQAQENSEFRPVVAQTDCARSIAVWFLAG